MKRLHIKRLDEVSLVDKGANQRAFVTLWKRAPEEKPVADPKDDTISLPVLNKVLAALGFGKNSIVAEPVEKRVKQMPNGKWAAMDDAGESMGMFDTEAEARAAAYGEKRKMADKPKDEPTPEVVSKADFAKLQADLEIAKADALKQAEKVTKLETERRDAEFTKRAEGYAPLPMKAPEFAVILRKCADVLTPEENAELDRVLSAASEMAKKAGLMKEIGSDSHEEGTAAALVAARVAELRKAEPKLTEVQARAQVYKSDPALRRKVENEQRAAQAVR